MIRAKAQRTKGSARYQRVCTDHLPFAFALQAVDDACVRVAIRGHLFLLVFCLALGCGEDGSTSDTIFVDEAAEPGGDGSEASPFTGVGEALTDVPPGGLVYVAPGTYPVPSSWNFDAAVTVLGSLKAPTVFVADSGETIAWSGSAEELITIRDVAFQSAFQVERGNLELRSVSVEGVGPALSLSNATVNMTQVDVNVSEAASSGDYADDALLVHKSSLDWSQGSAVDAPDRGIVIEESSVTMDDVAISSGMRAAVHLVEDSELTASALQLSDSGLGVFVQNSSLMLTNSEIYRTEQTSILGGMASVIHVEDSRFQDSPSGFIAASLNSTSVTLRRNTFLRAVSDNCVTVSAGTLLAEDNVINTCAGAGISALGVAVEIRDNEIRNILPDLIVGIVATAISTTDSTGSIERNTIAETMDNGISIIDSVVVVDSNTIGPVHGSGISYVDGPTTRSQFSNNLITEATGAGIIVLNASVGVEGNTIADTKLSSGTSFGDGIVFGSAANVTVTANTVTGSVRSGILFFDGAQGEVRDNAASGNGQYGVSELCIGEPNQVVVGKNMLMGNTAGESQLCSLLQ